MGRLYDLAKMTTATTGTGTVTLGSPVSSFLSFDAAGVQDGETVDYAIVDGTDREMGHGVYTTSVTTLTRVVEASTNSGSALTLSGSAVVMITPGSKSISGIKAIQLNNTTDLSLANSTWTLVTFDTATLDEASVYASGTPSRIIVPAGCTKARLHAQLAWNTGGSGSRHVEIRKNSAGSQSTGTLVAAAAFASATDQATTHMQSAWLACVPGDYFELFVFAGASSQTLSLTGSSGEGKAYFDGEFRQ